jgi:hypothetical protein
LSKKATIVVLIIVLLAGTAYFLSGRKSSEEIETESVIVNAIMAISDKWDAEELKAWADPGLIKAMGSQGQSAEQLMEIYSALGKLKSAPVCKVHTTGTFMKGGERHHTVSYDCAGDYEKGPASISLTLSKSESATEWRIYYINIHSDVFGEIIE